MRILFLSAWFPYPPDNGSKLRIYNLIRGLAPEHEVILISFGHSGQIDSPPALKKLCQKVHIVPDRPYNPKSARALMGLFSLKPRVLVDRYEPEMAKCIQAQLNDDDYDLVIASQWYMAAYWKTFWNYPAIFEEVELGVFEDKIVQASTFLHKLRAELTYLKLRHYLRNLLFRFEACTVVSENELGLLNQTVPNYHAFEVVPNGVNLVDYADISEEAQPDTLIFTGSLRYSANYEAMLWFLEEVYPKITSQIPGVRITVTGDHTGKPIPQTGNINLTGYVNDIRPFIASSWMSIAPIKTGGGTRLKILESMALHTPVIATSKGAQGLDAQHGEQLFIADTPDAFAEAVIELMKNPGVRKRLSDNAYQLIREKYDWAVLMPLFLDLVERVALFDNGTLLQNIIRA